MSSTLKNHIKPWSLAGSFGIYIILSTGSPVAIDAEIIPDFSLTDVNKASSTYNQPVSPRSYLEQVSGWYFGHAT